MNHIKELGIIDRDIQIKIFDFISQNVTENDLQPSLLYNTELKEKVFDTDVRDSKFKAIVDNTLFDHFDELVAKINEIDKGFEYTLVRNDITIISYKEGDFFKKHRDYLSFTSNIIEEYTLIVCMDANCEGGETIFHVNDFFKHNSTASTTPFHCLLFRKDIVHEGNVIRTGFKKILTCNLLCSQKTRDRYVAISFEKDPTLKTVISYENIMNLKGSMLATYIEMIETDEYYANKKIIAYHDHFSTHEEFKFIEKIYDRCYVKLNQLHEQREALRYYGIGIQNLLIDVSNNDTTQKHVSYKDDHDIIICESEAQRALMAETLSYVSGVELIPFIILFAEGEELYNEEYTNRFLTPVLCCFGDNDALLFERWFKDTIDQSDWFNHLANCMNKKDEEEEVAEEIIESKYYYDDFGFCPEFLFTFKKRHFSTLAKRLVDHITNIDTKKICSKNKMVEPQQDRINIYPKDYNRIVKRLQEIDFFDYMQNHINDVSYKFTQLSEAQETSVCNENVYTDLNLICMYGLLTM